VITVQVFDPLHLAAMVVQPAQLESRLTVEQRFARGCALSANGRCFTARRFHADAPALMCAGALETHPDLATLWAVFSEEAVRDLHAMVHIRIATRTFLAKLPHRRVDAMVRSDHRGGHVFAHKLGMAAEARLNDYFPDGGDAVVYRLKRAA
jgi:hypothetical protein